MNREYNDNKMYNSALDELRFSEEAKSRMVDRLMTAAEQPEHPVAIHRVRRFPRITAVGVAAALVLSIGAGATGVFKSASDAFAGVFGPTADTEIIDQIGRPIGASDTAGGVTVTADAILFDGYNYLISYTLEKEDGSAFDCTKNPDTGLLRLCTGIVQTAISDAECARRNPAVAISMTKIRMIMPFSMLKPCRTTDAVYDRWHSKDYARRPVHAVTVITALKPTTIADGTHGISSFKLEADNSAVELPAGQNIRCETDGAAAVDTSRYSRPSATTVVYTVDGEATVRHAVRREAVEEIPQENSRTAGMCSTCDLTLRSCWSTKTDGTVLDVLRHCGGSMDPHDGNTVCTRQGTFDTILPLDEVASVTIGDTTIPVE